MREIIEETTTATTATVTEDVPTAKASVKVTNEIKSKRLPIKPTLETSNDGNGNSYTSLSNIDNTVYINTRHGTGTAESMTELRGTIKQNGMLHPVVVSKQEDRFALVAGFRRYEAVTQNTLEPLIRKYNSVKGLKPTDDDFIRIDSEESRNKVFLDESKIPETEGTWKSAFISAIKSAKIKISIEEVKNALDARFKNMTENWDREDFTPFELCTGISEMVRDGVKQKEIATRFKKVPSKISQCLKIARMFDVLESEFNNAFNNEKITKEEHDTLIACIADLRRRSNLPKSNEESVSFSHLRVLSGKISAKDKDKKMPLSAIIRSLKALVKCGDNGKINTTLSPPDLGQFANAIEAYSKAELTIKSATEKAGTKDKSSEDVEETGFETEKDIKEAKVKESQADDDFIDASTLLEEEVKGESEKAEGEVTEDKTSIADDASELDDIYDDDAVSDEDFEVDEDGEDDEDDTDDEDGDPDSVTTKTDEDDDDELSDEEKKARELAKKKKEQGQSKVSIAEKPSEDRYKVKSGPQIEGLAKKYLEFAADPETTMVERACNLALTTELYNVAGLKDETNEMMTRYVEYVDGANDYMKGLTGLLKKAMKSGAITEEEAKEIVKLRPTFKIS